jgi:hypothetical protein
MNAAIIRRRPLKSGRRQNVNVNLSPAALEALGRLGRGNRSAAIEDLALRWAKRNPIEITEPTP